VRRTILALFPPYGGALKCCVQRQGKGLKWPGMLPTLSAGLLVAALSMAPLSMARASHAPDCQGLHPNNNPTPGNDSIVGTAGIDVLAGGAGNDTILGLGGNDVICGNDGDDTIHGDSGSDDLMAGSGNDLAAGGDDNDDILGEDGNDKLFASTVFMGPIPTFPQSCDRSGELPRVLGPPESGGNQNTEGGFGNSLYGHDGYDLLVGATRRDFLFGDAKGDDLYGLGGIDDLHGGAASDCLSGGPDADRLVDTYSPDGGDDIDTLWGGEAGDTLDAQDGDGRDSLRGGVGEFNRCTYDPGDTVFLVAGPFLPSICF
jgi:Ca2+-binding RTX toxin-like protein